MNNKFQSLILVLLCVGSFRLLSMFTPQRGGSLYSKVFDSSARVDVDGEWATEDFGNFVMSSPFVLSSYPKVIIPSLQTDANKTDTFYGNTADLNILVIAINNKYTECDLQSYLSKAANYFMSLVGGKYFNCTNISYGKNTMLCTGYYLRKSKQMCIRGYIHYLKNGQIRIVFGGGNNNDLSKQIYSRMLKSIKIPNPN